jgi:hypothetical protein
MQKTDEFMLKRIMWKIRKYKISDGFTFFFDDLSNEIKEYLQANIDTSLSGIPVIFFTKPSKEWTLVCTKQIIGYDSQKIIWLNFKDIAEIHGLHSKKKKLELDELMVFDKQNNKYVFHSNSGYDHNALHNLLLMCSTIH